MPRTVVVADDQTGYRLLLGEYLAGAYRTVLLEDGKEVLEFLKTATPDLLILDVNMPFVSGIDICDRVRLVSRLKDVPVLLITGQGELATSRLRCQVGAPDGILHKPFSTSELLAMVNRLMTQ